MAARDADELRRMQRLRAAAHASEPPLNMKRGDVAPDRRLGGRRHRDKLPDRGDRPLLHSVQDELMPLALVHRLPRTRIFSLPHLLRLPSGSVNQLRSNSFMVRRNTSGIDSC